MARVGETFKTGEKAPVSGDYEFVRHIDSTTICTPAEKEIPLSKDETFPPHKSCNKGAIWKLIKIR